MKTLYLPEWLYQDGHLRQGTGLLVDDAGFVLEKGEPDFTVSLPGRLLMPGFVNAHSHAFQRMLRGRFEYTASGDDFWSWREGMYRAANQLDPEGLYHVSRQAFLEMALAGITSVGEFHYLHHPPDGGAYEDEHELAAQVLTAAQEVGLRIVLLRVGYQRAGFQKPENPLQKRFLSPDAQAFLQSTQTLRTRFAHDSRVSVGIAPHSVRAVDKAWLLEIARAPKQLVHMHVAEQPAEVEACRAENHRRPVEYLEDLGLLHDGFTAVHAIHLSDEEVKLLGRQQANVCACPSTERNLGDGVVLADDLLSAKVSLCLGSDSQAHVDLLDEARQLEGHLRLIRLRRAVLDDGHAAANGLGRRLLYFATAGGARSLQLPVGRLLPNEPADFITLDLNHPSCLGVSTEALLSAVALTTDKAAIREVAVNGKLIVQEGRHAQQDAITKGYVKTLRRLSW